MKTCPECGREFEPVPNHPHQIYCSEKCCGRVSSRRQCERLRAARRPLEPRKCALCGKPFVATRPDRKYCSPNCAAAAYRDRNRTRFEPRACLWCGTIFTPTHHAKTQFCSPNCRRTYRYRHGSRDVTCAPRRTGGVDRERVIAYLRLPDDERYARRKELNQAERLLAMRIWNEWHLREEW